MNDLHERQSGLLVFVHIVTDLFKRAGLFLRLMRFPCVLERQTQLHINDTQILLGIRMHVCMCVFVLFDHFSQNAYKPLPVVSGNFKHNSMSYTGFVCV